MPCIAMYSLGFFGIFFKCKIGPDSKGENVFSQSVNLFTLSITNQNSPGTLKKNNPWLYSKDNAMNLTGMFKPLLLLFKPVITQLLAEQDILYKYK